jgi:growth factor receptor-binding protein 2
LFEKKNLPELVMEAKCLHNFEAKADDELTFKKGDVIKVLDSTDSDESGWWRAENESREGVVPASYLQLLPVTWYERTYTRKNAEDFLEEKPAGHFVVRDQAKSKEDFSLSVKIEGDIQHFKIMRDGGGKYFIWEVKFNSVNALIRHHKASSISRDGSPVFLLEQGESQRYTESPALSKGPKESKGSKEPKSKKEPPPAKSAVPPSRRPPAPPRDEKIAIALYDFEPANDDELEFTKGQKIKIIDDKSDDWWKGEANGKQGFFPQAYVEVK